MTLMAVPPRRAHVGERLIALREDLGLSQEEAVARTNGAITLRQWQRWEKGESEPYKRNLAKLSEVFDIPITDFFEKRAVVGEAQLDRIERLLTQIDGSVRVLVGVAAGQSLDDLLGELTDETTRALLGLDGPGADGADADSDDEEDGPAEDGQALP